MEQPKRKTWKTVKKRPANLTYYYKETLVYPGWRMAGPPERRFRYTARRPDGTEFWVCIGCRFKMREKFPDACEDCRTYVHAACATRIRARDPNFHWATRCPNCLPEND
jgi:hypothetical protein